MHPSNPCPAFHSAGSSQPRITLSAVWFLACALACAWLGIRAALASSIDFQWPGAHLLAQGLNPYAEALSDPPNALFTESRWPNYAQTLYVLMLPLGVLAIAKAKFIWALANLGFALASIRLLRPLVPSLGPAFLVVCGLWLLCSPLRTVFNNGQTTLAVTVCLAAALHAGRVRWIGVGLTYLKYSFAPFFGTWLMVVQGKRCFWLSFVGVALGLFVFLALFRDLTVLIQPLQVASRKVGSGVGGIDLLTQWLPTREGGMPLRVLGLLAGAMAAAWVCRPHGTTAALDPFRSLSACVILSLIFSSHLYYDYAITIIPALALLSSPPRRWPAAWAAALSMAFIWFGYGQTFNRFGPSAASLLLLIANLTILALLLQSPGRTSDVPAAAPVANVP